MRKLLVLALLLTASAAVHADPIPPFRAETVFTSPLYTEPMKGTSEIVDKIDGFRSTQASTITVSCGDTVQARVVARIQPNIMTGGQTAFFTAAFSVSTDNPTPTDCQKQAMAALPNIDIDIEITAGQQELNVTHPNYPHLVYKVHVAYTPELAS